MMAHFRTRMARGERGVIVPPSQQPSRRRRVDRTTSAATRLGITEAAYRAQLDAGLKWCSGCRDWHPRSTEVFARERSRRDGLSGSCKAWLRAYALARREAS